MKLGDICDINMGQSPSSETYNTNNSGIPFFQGNADFGERSPIVRIYCSKPTKIAKKGDILFSVRAPIGAINIADCECCIGRGLSALTPKKSTTEYLFFLLKAKNKILQSLGTGSTFKAINKNTLLSLPISSHSINEQRIISNKLSLIENAIRIRERQLVKLNQLAKSRFIEMFGDPISNSKGWEITKLEDLGELSRGISKSRPRNLPELLGGKYPLVQTGDVANSELYITRYNSTYSELGLKQSKMWKAGTLCITIAANIAKTAILKFDACFPDSIVGFKSNGKTNQIFIHYIFSFFQELLESQAPTVAQKNINLQTLQNLMVICPPSKFQNDFESFIQQLDKSKFRMKKCLKLFTYMRHLWKIEI